MTVELTNLAATLRGDWATLNEDAQQTFFTTNIGNRIQFTVTGAKTVVVELTSPSRARVMLQLNDTPWQTHQLQPHGLTIDLPDEATYTVQIVLQYLPVAELWEEGHGVNLTRIHADAGVMQPLPAPAQRVAFIGDSITLGARMTGEDTQATGVHHAPQFGFPARLAEHFDIEPIYMAYGGIGVTPSAPIQMPNAIDSLWQMNAVVPRPRRDVAAVVVNLGTNDINHGGDEQSLRFGLRLFFLELVKRFHDTPVLVMTPFNGQFEAVFVEEAQRFDHLTVIKTGDWQISPDHVHPDVAEHAQAAQKLVPYLATYLQGDK